MAEKTSVKDRLLALFRSPIPKKKPTGPLGQGGSDDWPWQFIQSPEYGDRKGWYSLLDELDTIAEIQYYLSDLADEAVQTTREHKEPIWIGALKEEKIKERTEAMDDLLYSRLRIQDHLWAIVRDVAKRGDDFQRLHLEVSGDKSEGVKAWEFLAPGAVERVDKDGEWQGWTVSYESSQVISQQPILAPWEISHFKMLLRKDPMPDGKVWPYGTSMIFWGSETSQRLAMLEDMLFLYRMEKTLDRYLIPIPIESLDVVDASKTINDWKTLFRGSRRWVKQALSGSTLKIPFNPLSIDESLYWPFRPGQEARPDTIAGNPNVRDIADFTYFLGKIERHLGTPIGYFTGEGGDLSGGQSISAQSLRFAKRVGRVQQAVMQGTLRIGLIHMACLGYSSDPKDYQPGMVSPSALADTQRLEALQQVVDATDRMAALADSLGLDKQNWIGLVLKTTFGFDDNEIAEYVSAGEEDQGGGDGGGPENFGDSMKVSPNRATVIMEKILKRMGTVGMDSSTIEIGPLPTMQKLLEWEEKRDKEIQLQLEKKPLREDIAPRSMLRSMLEKASLIRRR